MEAPITLPLEQLHAFWVSLLFHTDQIIKQNLPNNTFQFQTTQSNIG